MSKMKHILRKLHIGGSGNFNDHHTHPLISSPQTPITPIDTSSSSSSSAVAPPPSTDVDFNFFEEEFQMQLALAISVSDPEAREDRETAQIKAAKQRSLGCPPSQTLVEFLSLRYWSNNVVNYDEKVMDGFYDVYGTNLNSVTQGKMPQLVDLQAVPVSEKADCEVILVDRTTDLELLQLEERVCNISLECQASGEDYSLSCLIQKIAGIIVDKMGGPVVDADQMLRKWNARSYELRSLLNTVVLPLGGLDVGLSRHRALLFKVLADKINLPCMLVKGSYYTGTDEGAVNLIKVEAGRLQLKIMEEKNLKPRDSTYVTLTVTCCKSFELDLAEIFLDKISQPRHPRPYNAFLKACGAMDRPELGLRVLAKMKKLNLKPNIRTYELLFSLYGKVNMPYEEGDALSQADSAKRIKAIELDMMRNGLQHSYISIRNVLKALRSEGMMKEILHYLHVAENLFSHTDIVVTTSMYNIALHSLVKAKESRLAIEMYKAMTSCGHEPNVATYSIMIDCCSVIGCFRSASAIVSIMIRKGYYPQVIQYTALIKVLLVCDDFDEALNLMYGGFSEGIELDAIYFNTIIQSAFDKKRMDVIEVVVELMHQKRVPPDAITCGLVFSAYVDAGYLATAMEALQVLAMRMISLEDENTLLEKRALFEEDFILSEDSEAVDMKLIDLFENSEEDVAFALLNLRWCSIAGFPISWSPHKSQWALRLSTQLAVNNAEYIYI